MPNKIVETKNLTVGQKSNIVIEKMNLTINKGEIVFITGTNGTGKTTLVKTILGLIEPKTGEIFFEGKSWSKEYVKNNFGYLPQHAELDRSFPISVQELIELSCNNEKCDLDPSTHLKYLNSENLISKSLSDLSGGEFQRVMIARSLINSPKIVVYDEPTNNLDAETSQNFLKLVNKLHKNNITQLIITHDHEFSHQVNPRRELVISKKRVEEVQHD